MENRSNKLEQNVIAQKNIDIGMFYIILCEQMKYFGIDNKILTPYTIPHII